MKAAANGLLKKPSSTKPKPTSVAAPKVPSQKPPKAPKPTGIKTKKLDKKGDTVLKVTDTNGSGVTTYVVKLVTSERVQGSKSKKLRLE